MPWKGRAGVCGRSRQRHAPRWPPPGATNSSAARPCCPVACMLDALWQQGRREGKGHTPEHGVVQVPRVFKTVTVFPGLNMSVWTTCRQLASAMQCWTMCVWWHLCLGPVAAWLAGLTKLTTRVVVLLMVPVCGFLNSSACKRAVGDGGIEGTAGTAASQAGT